MHKGFIQDKYHLYELNPHVIYELGFLLSFNLISENSVILDYWGLLGIILRLKNFVEQKVYTNRILIAFIWYYVILVAYKTV